MQDQRKDKDKSVAQAGVGDELVYATLVAAVAVAIGIVAEKVFGFDELSLIFITAVILVAVRSRLAIAVYAAILCFLSYNFFFIHPRYTFYITSFQDVATVGLFLAAALVCGRLANKLQAQVVLLRAANAQASALQRLGQRLTSAADEGEAIRAARQALQGALDAEVILFTAEEATGAMREALQDEGSERFDPALQASVDRCLDRSKAMGNAVPQEDARDLSWYCLPVKLRDRVLGVACFRFPSAMPELPSAKADLVEAMLRDLAQALARARLVHQLEEARVQAESERLRAALLSSVSHDLRSPLSTIIGSAESLSIYHDQLSSEDQLALAKDIHGEGQRLDRYIQNLLDMTRVGQGALAIAREWIGLDEICGTVLARLRRTYPAAHVRLELPADVPLLHVHPALMEQALFNVLDNAVKFSPAMAPVTLRAARHPDGLQIDVSDLGPGIPEAERLSVFDRFHTSERSERSGTGLGLTISQGIVLAHQGTVLALPGENGIGTLIRMILPLDVPPADAPRDD